MFDEFVDLRGYAGSMFKVLIDSFYQLYVIKCEKEEIKVCKENLKDI